MTIEVIYQHGYTPDYKVEVVEVKSFYDEISNYSFHTLILKDGSEVCAATLSYRNGQWYAQCPENF